MLDIRKISYGARVAIALGETNVGLTNTYVLCLMLKQPKDMMFISRTKVR